MTSGIYNDSSHPAAGQGNRYGDYQGTVEGEIYIYKDHDPRFHIITDPVLTDNPVSYSGGLVILERDGLHGYADFEGNRVTDILGNSRMGMLNTSLLVLTEARSIQKKGTTTRTASTVSSV